MLGGPVKEVLPVRQGAFLSAQQEDIASIQGAVPERDVPQEGGGGGLCHNLRKTQKQDWEGYTRVQYFSLTYSRNKRCGTKRYQ